jgi:DNA (cytosine-5)-methyltransferase 1
MPLTNSFNLILSEMLSYNPKEIAYLNLFVFFLYFAVNYSKCKEFIIDFMKNIAPKLKRKEYKGIDIFSGAGGMSLGASMAGIHTVVAVEHDKHAANSFIHNHPDSKMINDDIKKINPKDLIDETPFVLFGGPPCQGFSLSNTKTRNVNNTNNSLFEEFIRFVTVLNPYWVVFENVEGFQSFDNGNIAKELEKRLSSLGYNCTPKVLCAADYGVPQKRNRFFLVGNRVGKKFKFPKSFKKSVSVGDAIKDLPKLQNGASINELPYLSEADNSYLKLMRRKSKASFQNFVSRNRDYVIERYKHIKPGQNWKAIPDELMANYKDKNNCHSGIYRRLNPKAPSVVISNYRKNMLIHPSEHRGLSVREAARIQSFPDKFAFHGTLMHIQQQIGNAVPPLLAKAIFKKIISTHNAQSKS